MAMLIWSAGGAPPAGPGNATSVLIAIRFQCVTSLACAAAGAASAIAAASAAHQVLLLIRLSPRGGVPPFLTWGHEELRVSRRREIVSMVTYIRRGIREREERFDRRPVPRGGGHPERLARERRPELRARDRLRVPRVDLSGCDHDPLFRRGSLLQLARDVRAQLRREKGHLGARRLRRHLAERVALHDRGELGSRAHDDRNLEAEALRDQLLHLPPHGVGVRGAFEHDVAALEVGLHVFEASILERLAQLGHRDAVARADVDAAQQYDVPGHRQLPGRRSASRFKFKTLQTTSGGAPVSISRVLLTEAPSTLRSYAA